LTPRLVVVVELGRAPVVVIDALDEAEVRRLLDWLEAHADFADVVALAFESAVELMREERAA
jgi:low affinity Fe/Cu permease